jgi:signal transduction histidine kinase
MQIVVGVPRRSLFVAAAGHEILNMATSIRLNLELVANRSTDDLTTIAVRRAIDRLDSMLDLSRRLLDTAPVVDEAIELHRECLTVGRLVDDIVGSLPSAGDRDRVRLHDTADARLFADRILLLRVLDNLIGNALKYSNDRAPVDVEVRVQGEDVLTHVVDAGGGVPMEDRAELFAPFYRGSGNRGLPGHGLGLFLSRHIAELHGGSLHLARSGPAGSDFILSLPR